MKPKNIFIAGVLAAALAPGAFAQNAGSVLSVSGPEGAVVGMRANATFPVTPGTALQVGDLILVGADASVSLAGAGGCQKTLESLQSLTVGTTPCAAETVSLSSSASTQDKKPPRKERKHSTSQLSGWTVVGMFTVAGVLIYLLQRDASS